MAKHVATVISDFGVNKFVQYTLWEKAPGEGAADEDEVPKKPLQFSAINSEFWA